MSLTAGQATLPHGLMQHDVPLDLQHAFRRLHGMHGQTGEVVSLRTAEGEVDRLSYREVGDRALKLASALESLGVRPGTGWPR